MVSVLKQSLSLEKLPLMEGTQTVEQWWRGVCPWDSGFVKLLCPASTKDVGGLTCEAFKVQAQRASAKQRRSGDSAPDASASPLLIVEMVATDDDDKAAVVPCRETHPIIAAVFALASQRVLVQLEVSDCVWWDLRAVADDGACVPALGVLGS